MPFQQRFVNWVITTAVMLAWIMTLPAPPAIAQTPLANYALLVGAGFLCDLGDSSACPAVVKSADGSSYELTGVGMFDAQEKSLTATGTFVRKSPAGNTVETGVWIAKELVSFNLYGFAPGALMRAGTALGPLPFGPRPVPMTGGQMLGAPMRGSIMPAGGLAVLRIRLLPVLGFARNATLEVNCALGKVPAEHQTEGIRLAFERGGVEYDEEISGRVLFLLTRPGASGAAKAPAPEAETSPAPAEAQQ